MGFLLCEKCNYNEAVFFQADEVRYRNVSSVDWLKTCRGFNHTRVNVKREFLWSGCKGRDGSEQGKNTWKADVFFSSSMNLPRNPSPFAAFSSDRVIQAALMRS